MDPIEQAQALWKNGCTMEAIKLLRPLSKQGNLHAKSLLGLIYCHYFENDSFPYIHTGQQLLEAACEQGEASACHNLGTLWLGHTPSIGSDPKLAATYYLRARDLAGPVADADFYDRMKKLVRRPQ